MSFKFTVICPVFNMEQYIRDAFESIEKQTIGFEDNIQIVFVNDGSLDCSGEQCLDIRKRYPDNVVYIEKENGGVSSARNEGIKWAQGDYIIFLDPDDKWDVNAFERINSFFAEYSKETDACICKMEYIGDYEGERHVLDFRFDKGTRLADLSEEPACISSTIGNMAFRKSGIGDVRFNETISSGEDSTFTNTVLLRKLTVGVVANAVFYYRRSLGVDSGAPSAARRKSWYCEVPKVFYLGLCKESETLYGNVVPYIQEVMLYDLRWRKYNTIMGQVLSDDEKQEYISIMKGAVSHIDDERILNAEGFNQYRKIYLLYLKYGERLAEGLHVEGKELYNKDNLRLLSFRSKSFFSIETIEIEDNTVILQGILLSRILGEEVQFFIKDETGKRYQIQTHRYEKEDKRGSVGEIIAEAHSFCAHVPICPKRKLGFYAVFHGEEVELNPGYGADTGLERYSMSYTMKNGYVMKYLSRKLCFYDDTRKMRFTSKRNYIKNVSKQKNSEDIIEKHLSDLKLKDQIDNMKLKKRVAFISARSNDNTLLPNLANVYEKCMSEKVIFAKKGALSEEDIRKGADAVYHSKVVATDDYSIFLRKYGKKKGQAVVQLWHAAGAFKRFGQDGTELFPPVDKLYHKDYDVVAVSAPSLSETYAHAFGIEREIVKPLGVPRTDSFFDEENINSIKAKILADHPELRNKEIILYAPTFRNNGGQKKNHFTPNLDFNELSGLLNDDQVFLICPHPVMQNEIISRRYHNIFVMRDYSTNDYMLIADLLVTDYSSVIFEYSLLNKPMAFYCYDYDTYNRDFYLDYETDLPGPIFKNQKELFDYLQQRAFDVDDRLQMFKKKYMSACDGHSAERIAELIDSLCR